LSSGGAPAPFDHFAGLDIRVGRILEVEEFPEARVPAWKLRIDFGPEVGEKRSSAQITHYAREDLEGRLIVAVTNFEPKRIAGFKSECLVLGALNDANGVVLLRPDADAAEPGDRIA
jgi:tRNA-binding protein